MGGRIVTFYSYKGGTGRSMALANVAWVLASNGARVLVVDWDLEAPGLHRYFRPFLTDKDLVGFESEGVIDFVLDVAHRLATPSAETAPRDQRWIDEHADVSQWTKRLTWPSGEDAVTGLKGTIDFVPAGRQGPQYAQRVNSFDWAGFYEKYNGGAFMDALRRSMERYDWVLIDSRTGVSDTSGICTVHFPDTLVVCFTLNYQNIDGGAAVAASARAQRKDRELRILPLPTRLDGNEEKSLKAMMAHARRRFDGLLDSRVDPEKYWREMGVPYFSRYAYAEKLAPFEDQVNVSTSTLPAMERLVWYLSDGLMSSLRPLPEAHRLSALSEYEQLDDASREAALPGPVASARGAGGFLRELRINLVRSWYASSAVARGLFSLAVPLTFVAFYLGGAFSRSPPSTSTLVSKLIAEANTARTQERLERSALLVAEAAARLDPATVVSESSESGKEVFAALRALQPFRLASSDSSSAPSLPVATRAPRYGTRGVAFSPDGRFLASTGPAQPANLFRFPLGNTTGPAIESGYSAIAFSPDSRYLASGGRNGSLIVLDLSTGARAWQWENPDPSSAWIRAVAFSPNGNLLAAGTDTGHVLVARVDPWKEIASFPEARASAVAFSPDSKLLATGGAGLAHLWTPEGVLVRKLETSQGAVTSIHFAGADVVVRTEGRTQSFRWSSDAALSVPAVPESAYSIAVSPDFRSVAYADGQTVEVKKFAPADQTFAPNATINFPEVTAMAFAPGGGLLACASVKGELRAWTLGKDAGPALATIPFPSVNAISISPDRQFVAVAAREGTFLAFLPTDTPGSLSAVQARSLACSQTGSERWTQDDWTRHFRSEPLRDTCSGF